MPKRTDQSILRSVNDLLAAVTQLVNHVAKTTVTAATAGARTVASQAAGPAAEVGEKSKRLRSAIRAHWASMSPKERADRVRRMLAGRGLKPKPKSARGPAKTGKQGAKRARLRSAIKAHWASMSPKERADRVRRMLAGRGLEPKPKG